MKRILLMIVGVCLWTSNGLAVPARVQAKSGEGHPANPITITFTGTPTNGNAFIIGIGYFFGNTPTSVTDSNGVACTHDVDLPAISGGAVHIYSCLNISGSPTGIIINNTGADYLVATAVEVSGLATSSAFDQTANSGSPGNPYSSGNTPTTSQASEYLFGVEHVQNVQTTNTPDSPWTNSIVANDSTFETVDTQDQVVSATGQYATTGTSQSTMNSAVIATYKGAAAAAASGGCMPPFCGILGQ